MAGSHQRNTGPMRDSPRCGATTRRETSCEAPAVNGSLRCRMHGGNGRPGAPLGNRNAAKVGSVEALARLIRRYGPPTDDFSRLDLGSPLPPASSAAQHDGHFCSLLAPDLAALLTSEAAVAEAEAFRAALSSDDDVQFERKRRRRSTSRSQSDS